MRLASTLIVMLVAIKASVTADVLTPDPGELSDSSTIAADSIVSSIEAGDTSQAVVVTSPLQSLIDSATSGDTIFVKPGTYVGSLTFRGKNVTLRSTEGPDVTILDNSGGTGAVVGMGPAGTLTGFTIRKGTGVIVRGVGSVIRGNIISDNLGGIDGNTSSPLIEGNIFRNNHCDSQFSSGVVYFGNTSSPTIVNNVFEGNPCRAINLVLPAGNRPAVLNNTIVRNDVGIRVHTFSNALEVYENNVIVDNVIGLQADVGVGANNLTWRHNLVFGNEVNYEVISDQTGQNGNISADPQFIDADGGDYHLNESSPAIDSGDSAAPRLPATDFEGDGRVLDGNKDSLGVVDMGADEFTWRNRPPVANAGPDQTVECEDSTPVAMFLDGRGSTDPDSTPGTGDDIVAFDWFEDFESPTQSVLGSGEQVLAYFQGGAHLVTLRATDRAGRTGLAMLTVTVGPARCDDDNPCTSDIAAPKCGCDHVATPGVRCDDGNACRTVGTCDATGACAGVEVVDCNDGNVCTEDVCDPAIGCVNTPVNVVCDDLDTCTSNDTCYEGMCRGTRVDDGTPCDDHNSCMGNDICSGGSCRGTAMVDGSGCDDLEPCTSNDICSGGYCRGTVAEDGKQCDDQNGCTTNDLCHFGWCYGSTVPDGTECDDSNPCTSKELCEWGACVANVPLVESPSSPIGSAHSVGVGDFNRDGYPDLLAQKAGNYPRFAIFLGNGSGGFTESSSAYSVAGTSSALTVVADFNLDTKPDFAAVTHGASQSSVVVYLGDGAGGIVPVNGPATTVDPYVWALVMGDFNNDGRPDLAVASQTTNKVTILVGDGIGGFVARAPVAAGPDPRALATGDFNGDGKLDLAVATPGTGGGVMSLLGDGLGGVSPTPVTPFPAGSSGSSIAVGDFDHDGDQDLAVADPSFTSTRVWILRGNGQGGFSAPFAVSSSWDSYSVKAADLDLDGQLDLVIGYFGYPAVQVLIGDGSAYTFRRSYGLPHYFPGEHIRVTLSDLDRDGRMDVIAETDFPGEVRILLNRSINRACPSTDGCTTNACTRSTGQCTPVPAFLGSACDDRNLCTTNDSCIGGACHGTESSGATCDDANVCTLGDACGGGFCSGTPSAGPPEMGFSVRVSRVGSVATVTWNPTAGATTTSVLRGQVGSLPVGSASGEETCLASRLSASTASTLDADVPQEGSGFWYLVRAENACGAGPYGYEARNDVPTLPETSTSCP
jgi:hypothetical protein